MKRKKLIVALQKTADDLDNGFEYEWGHMARCNAGCLVRNLMDKTQTEVVEMVDGHLDEWTEYADAYCKGTNKFIDDLFQELEDYGLSHEDVLHLENLSDPKITGTFPLETRYLQRNNPKHVSKYMRRFAEQLDTVAE
jgi:hypothetical protein